MGGKKKEESDSNCRIEKNNNKHVEKNDTSSRGISIAERRGFAAHFIGTAAPAFFTVSPGISPSDLLDSPVMLSNVETQLSPTTGTFQLLKLSEDDAVPMEAYEEVGLSEPNNFTTHEINKPLEECMEECRQEMRQNQMMFEHQVKTEPSSQDQRNHHSNNSSAAIPKEVVKKNSDDGFYWRKYGQKHVKGSEYPRSYYKCTNTNCHVTKKVERSHDGHITEIVYNGSHNHPQPQPLKSLSEDLIAEAKTTDGPSTSEFRPDASPSYLNDFAFQEFDRNEASPGSAEDDDLEAKKRKRESRSLGIEIAVPRSSREPKVVVQIKSDIDILDDGYRWRKYGQKVVKGNPNPRSYYKCTTPGCPVRKHVERAAHDIKSVITTYEGKHNHHVPTSKNGLQVSSDDANLPPPEVPSKAAEVQDRKPILNYNQLIGPNLYPVLPFPPFHSLPPYGLMNTNPSYPMMPHFMPMPSSHAATHHHHHHHHAPHGGTYHYGSSSYAAQHQLQPSTSSRPALMPKEEQFSDEDELYDTCLSLPNQGNGM